MKTLYVILLFFLSTIMMPAWAQKKTPTKTTKKQTTTQKKPAAKPSSAADKSLPPMERTVKLYNEAKVLRSKNFNSKDAQTASQIAAKFREAGNGFLKADSFKTGPEKLYLQSHAMLSYGSAMYFLRKSGNHKEVFALADEIAPKLWMEQTRLPRESNSVIAKDTSLPISQASFVTIRAELFEEIVAAAMDKDNNKYIFKFGPQYLAVLPKPESKLDKKLYMSRLETMVKMAHSSIRLRNGDSCRKYVPEPFEFVSANRSYAPEKELVLKQLRTIDTMLRNPKYNYTDFDNDAKVRALAARTFDKLDDHAFAYKLYDETIRSGNRSLSLFMARAEAAANMSDMEKLDISLLAIDEKMYTGKMNTDYEKRIKEYKRMLKRD